MEELKAAIQKVEKPTQDELFQACERHLRNIISKYDSLFSKKCVAFVHNRAFGFHRGDLYSYYVVDVLPKKRYYSISHIGIQKFKTKGGQMFLLYQGGDSSQVCLTAHYFERYAERVFGIKDRTEIYKRRDEAVAHWAKEYVLNMASGVATKLEKESIVLPHPRGMGLGEYKEGILLVKTFVGENMLRDGQAKTREMLLNMKADNRSPLVRASDSYVMDKHLRSPEFQDIISKLDDEGVKDLIEFMKERARTLDEEG